MTAPWEIDDFLTTRNGHLAIDGIDAASLATEFGTPLFVYSQRRIQQNLDRILAIRSRIDCGLKICYAAKAMSTLGILRTVRAAGCDVEVNSGGELFKALKAGFSGEQIIFNGTSKEEWEIEMAIENAIYAIQVDSIFELEMIAAIARRLGRPANASLRLVPEIESNTHSGLQTALITSKFGMMPEEAFAAFARYNASPHVKLSGIHIHIGSQNPDPSVYTDAFYEIYNNIRQIYAETGYVCGHVNLGGGFPVNYLRDRSSANEMQLEQRQLFGAEYDPVEAIGTAWDEAVRRAKADGALHILEDLTLLLEPGRSIIADAGICLTTVRNAKERPSAGGRNPTDTWLLTDAGFNVLLSMETYKWYYHLISAERATEPHNTPYKLAGPLCDGGDVYFDIEGKKRLPDYRFLPENVRPGEILALLNCGAYSLSQASQYNGRFLPPVVSIDASGQPKLIRRRDRLDDLINNEIQ